MSKLKIGITALTLAVIVLGSSYALFENFTFSSSCGSQFSREFKEAVENNNVNFCSNYNGDLRFGRDWGYGKKCTAPKIGGMESSFALNENNPAGGCILAYAAATGDAKACLLADESTKITCAFVLRRTYGNVEVCDLVSEGGEEAREACRNL